MTPADGGAAFIVTSQHRADWPAKDYPFRDQGQARMFLAMCQRDGDYRCSLRVVQS